MHTEEIAMGVVVDMSLVVVVVVVVGAAETAAKGLTDMRENGDRCDEKTISLVGSPHYVEI